MDTLNQVEHPRSRTANLVLVVLFLGAIWTPLAINVVGVRTLRLNENRVRSTRPRLDLTARFWRHSRLGSKRTSTTHSACGTSSSAGTTWCWSRSLASRPRSTSGWVGTDGCTSPQARAPRTTGAACRSRGTSWRPGRRRWKRSATGSPAVASTICPWWRRTSTRSIPSTCRAPCSRCTGRPGSTNSVGTCATTRTSGSSTFATRC